MNQRKMICYTEGQLPRWIMEQLTMGLIEVFFPVSFVKEEESLTAVYQIDGYRPLSHLLSLPTEEVFQLLCQVISWMEQNEKHYLFPERYRIAMDTVYYDSLKNRIKMIFIPNEEGNTGTSMLCQLVRDCRKLVSEEGKSYLDSLAEELEKHDFGYRGAIHRCEMMQQEIYVCDIP